MPDHKAFAILVHGNLVDDETADVASQMAIENTFKKGVYFALFTLNFDLDSAIDQITHPTNHVVTGSDRSDRKPKTHALHAALI